MRKGKKIIIVVTCALLVVGIALFIFGVAMLGFNFKKFDAQEIRTSEYALEEEFENIVIDVDTSDVSLIALQNTQGKVRVSDKEKVKHTVTVKDKTLFIGVEDTRKWYDHIGIHFDELSVTLELPSGNYKALTVETDTGNCSISQSLSFENITVGTDTGDITMYASCTGTMDLETDTGFVLLRNTTAKEVKIETDTGDINLADVTVEETLQRECSTGKTTLTRVKAKNFISNGSTGDVHINECEFLQTLRIKTSTGDVRIELSDAGELFVETSTGDVKGILLSEKIFITKTSTGDIRVPSSTAGGRCEITTSTGDIFIEIQTD